MPYTSVQVCNLALSKVGDEAAQITSLPATPSDDYPKEANLCLKFYEPSLKEVLRMHAWNCAKRRTKLAQLTDAPSYGWDYQHAIPADCIRPLSVSPTDGSNRTFRYNSEWVVEARVILSNQSDLWMLYIQDMADLASADSLFIKTLYTVLAAKLAYPLTQNRNLVKDITTEFETIVLPDARRVNSFEGKEFPIIDSAWLEASYAGFSGVPIQQFEMDGYGAL